MKQEKLPKTWPGEPPALWPAPEPATRDERRTDAERIGIVREGIRIDHSISRRVGGALLDFIDRPWEPHQRWRGLLLIGPARSGRSWLVSHSLPQDGYVRRNQVITAQLPVDLVGNRLFHAIMDATSKYGASELKGHDLRVAVLRELETARALVFDGCDHLANLSGPRLWRVLARIKGIAEGQRVPVVLVVNPPTLQIIAGNPDWESRFETLHLPRWRMDAEFLALLTTWEDQLPLQESSRLADREMALHLYSLCDGSIGRLSDILREATMAAIGNARERITISLLDSLGISPPPSFRSFLF